jgi:vesicle transport through interaction with t-SNAREs protein 1
VSSLFSDGVIATSVDIESELSESEGYLRAMDVEFRTMASADKKHAQTKFNDYREEYKQTLQRYQSTKFNAEAQALKGGPGARSKLLNSNQKLDNSTALLEQSRSMIANTEKVGTTIITDMESQKETLKGAQEKVQETRSITGEARKILKQMGNRAIMHKICVGFTIVVLLVVIGVIAWFGFISQNVPTKAPSSR